MTTLFMAPVGNGPITESAFPDGTTARASAGGPAQIPDPDFVAALQSGWIFVSGIGPTSQRATWLGGPVPNTLTAGILGGTPDDAARHALLQVAPPYFYYDSTLAKMIFYDAATTSWRDPANGNSV
jgi:hypothetical protein